MADAGFKVHSCMRERLTNRESACLAHWRKRARDFCLLLFYDLPNMLDPRQTRVQRTKPLNSKTSPLILFSHYSAGRWDAFLFSCFRVCLGHIERCDAKVVLLQVVKRMTDLMCEDFLTSFKGIQLSEGHAVQKR